MTTNTEHTQELTDKINESIAAVCAETDTAKQNESYRAWLRTLSRFYSYFFNNWLLIYTQRPDASRVAGFQTWKSLGRDTCFSVAPFFSSSILRMTAARRRMPRSPLKDLKQSLSLFLYVWKPATPACVGLVACRWASQLLKE